MDILPDGAVVSAIQREEALSRDPTMSNTGIKSFPRRASGIRAFALFARIAAIGLTPVIVAFNLAFMVGDSSTPGLVLGDLLELRYWPWIGIFVGYVISWIWEFRGVLIAVLCWGLSTGHYQLTSEVPMSFPILVANAEWQLFPVLFIVLGGLFRVYLYRSGRQQQRPLPNRLVSQAVWPLKLRP